MTPGWLKISGAAEYCSCSVRTIRAWTHSGLKYIKVNGTLYFRPAWLDAYIMSHGDFKDTEISTLVEGITRDFINIQ